MKREIPLSTPNLNPEILSNLQECIESGWVSTGGHFIDDFESAVAAYAGVQDAVSCQSGTAGLHVALQILGVEAGDEVLAPTLTFIAAVNPIRYLGAEPVFLDCDASFCLDPAKLERFCQEECNVRDGRLCNRKTGRPIKAIAVVHIFGNLADMDVIMRVAKQYDLKVLEDATEALGSRFLEGRYAGRHAGTVGDMGVFSFNANKIITTGGGGMIVSRDQKKLDRARYLTTTAKDDGLYFVHGEVGYNYRMLNLQAALGVSQIRELDSFIDNKKKNYRLYQKRVETIAGLNLLPYREGIRPNYWFYPFEIEETSLGLSRDDLMHMLIRQGIQCRPVWRLNHFQKPYESSQTYEISRALQYEKTVLNLPCSSGLSKDDVHHICDMIERIAAEKSQ